MNRAGRRSLLWILYAGIPGGTEFIGYLPIQRRFVFELNRNDDNDIHKPLRNGGMDIPMVRGYCPAFVLPISAFSNRPHTENRSGLPVPKYAALNRYRTGHEHELT
ncbi:hypothetical protein K445DRAFT_319938 [Daldinia sp. EC12]|nr:hypothetical protein K445DRAFT_319938 [Daldinia sp. EC12]